MIAYNPKDWFTFIFKLHKSDTVRQLFPMMIAITIYAAVVSYLEIYIVHIDKDSQLKNLSLIYSMLGFVISLLLVFRTNTAYDRWWEGRRLWGQLINTSRNLSIKLNQILQQDAIHKQALKTLIPYFAVALKSHLRNENTIPDLDENATAQERFDFHENINHLPNHVAKEIFEEIDLLYKEKQISDAQLLIINSDYQQFIEICGACERIKNSPIPYSYSAFLKKFIFFYIMLMPFAYVASLGFTIIPVTVFTFYILTSIELIAEEIENPFGTDANDLPLDELCKNIKRTTNEIFS
jgi:putative membrane protein